MTTATTALPQATAARGGFDLDVTVTPTGDAVAALLCSTDNGCGTQSHNGC